MAGTISLFFFRGLIFYAERNKEPAQLIVTSNQSGRRFLEANKSHLASSRCFKDETD